MTNAKDVVFPNGIAYQHGLTKREHFASMAMQGYLASMPPELYAQVRNGTLGFRILSESAVAQADALILALNKDSQ